MPQDLPPTPIRLTREWWVSAVAVVAWLRFAVLLQKLAR